MQKLTERVFVETRYYGANVTAIVTNEGVVSLDCPFYPSNARRWKKALRKRGELTHLLHTEHHLDHTASDCFLVTAETEIVAHKGIKDILQDPDYQEQTLETYLSVLQEADPRGYDLARELHRFILPTRTFGTRMPLEVGDVKIRMFHRPGHTLWQTTIWLPEEGVVTAGDNLFNDVFPRMHECEPRAWLEALDELESLDCQHYIPGHGKVGDVQLVRDMKAYLQELMERVEAAIGHGWSLEQTVRELALPTGTFQIPAPDTAEHDELRRTTLARFYTELSSA